MTTLFVTASGTEIGKTFVTRALIHQLRQGGRNVRALKPVATGMTDDSLDVSDSGLLLSALGRPVDAAGIASVSPWRFRDPLSPDMAAEREGRCIPFDQLVAFCRGGEGDGPEGDKGGGSGGGSGDGSGKGGTGEGITLIEGIGGVMVPLDRRHTVLDWIAALGAPALLVTGSYLGTLSHTLTAVGMLRARSVEIAGIVVNESEAQPVAPEETAAALSRFAASVPVQVVRRLDSPENAPDLVHLIKRACAEKKGRRERRPQPGRNSH